MSEANDGSNEHEIRMLYARLDELMPIKYGRDHHQQKTLGEFVEGWIAEADRDRFCDLIDADFIHGAWGDVFCGPATHYLKKDIRGIVWALCERVRAAEASLNIVTSF